MTLAKLFEQFLQAGIYLRGWSAKTPIIYRRAFASFEKAQGTVDLPNLASQLRPWIVARREAGASTTCINMYIRAMNAFCSWLKEEGYIAEAIVQKQLRAPHKQLVTFSDAQMRQILSFRPKRFEDVRLFTLISLLVDTGLRIDEALSIQTARVDLENLFIIVQGKGNRERKVPMSLELRKVLFRYLQAKEKRGLRKEYLFCVRSGVQLRYRNTYRDIKRLCAHVGVKGAFVRPHCFRHYFAVKYIRNGGDIYRLSRILGHSNISTTQVYLRSMGIEQLAERHSELTPLRFAS
jgi:integrase/recombinase XerD